MGSTLRRLEACLAQQAGDPGLALEQRAGRLAACMPNTKRDGEVGMQVKWRMPGPAGR